MYVAKEFTEYSTISVFLNHLKEYLLGTGIFTLVEEDFEEKENGIFKLQYKNAVIEFLGAYDGKIHYKYYLIINDNEVAKQDGTISTSSSSSSTAEARSVKILLINNNNNLFFKISSYAAQMLDISSSPRLIVTDNELYAFVSGNTTSADAVNDIDESYTYRPYHPYSKSQTELFLDPELPWTKVSDGSFYSNSIGITGLGGAECGKIYQLADGTKYYAIFNNMAIEMGEEFVYESTEA